MNYISILIFINVVVQIPMLIFIVPRSYYPMYLMFLVFNIVGLICIQFAILLKHRECTTKRLKFCHSFFTALYGFMLIVLVAHYFDSKFYLKKQLTWKVKKYKYGPYDSNVIGFSDGWFSGNMNSESDKLKHVGAIGFSFREPNDPKEPLQLPVLKNEKFSVDYSVSKHLLMVAVFEGMYDVELSTPMVCFVSPDTSKLVLDLSKMHFHKQAFEGRTPIKHLKIIYNSGLNHLDFLLAKLLWKLGAGSVVLDLYF